jgi:putative transposase
MVDLCGDYPWNSYAAYASAVQQDKALVDTSLGLGIMGGRETLLRFMNTPNDDRCLDLENVTPVSDSELLCLLNELLGGVSISSLADMNPEQRNRILRQLKAVEGISILPNRTPNGARSIADNQCLTSQSDRPRGCPWLAHQL